MIRDYHNISSMHESIFLVICKEQNLVIMIKAMYVVLTDVLSRELTVMLVLLCVLAQCKIDKAVIVVTSLVRMQTMVNLPDYNIVLDVAGSRNVPNSVEYTTTLTVNL